MPEPPHALLLNLCYSIDDIVREGLSHETIIFSPITKNRAFEPGGSTRAAAGRADFATAGAGTAGVRNGAGDPADWPGLIQEHTFLFLLYRLALILGFALLLGMPFALFRIVIAQEIVGREEIEADDDEEQPVETNDDDEEKIEDTQVQSTNETNGMPAFAWRGKGFAVIAAWTGLSGLLFSWRHPGQHNLPVEQREHYHCPGAAAGKFRQRFQPLRSAHLYNRRWSAGTLMYLLWLRYCAQWAQALAR